jgi:hypothetical protein
MKLWAKNGRKRKLLIIIKSPEEGLVQGWNMLCKIKCELKNSYLQASCVCKNWFINQKEWCFFPQKFCRISAASLAQTASPFNEYCVWRAKEGGGLRVRYQSYKILQWLSPINCFRGRFLEESSWGVALSSSAAWPKLGPLVIETFFTTCENELALGGALQVPEQSFVLTTCLRSLSFKWTKARYHRCPNCFWFLSRDLREALSQSNSS